MSKQRCLLLASVLFLLLAVSYTMPAAHSDAKSIVYVETDAMDNAFLDRGFRKHILPAGRIVGLSEVVGAQYSLAVLPDPNWAPGEFWIARSVSQALIQRVEEGSKVVVGLNGAVLLNITLARLGLPFPPASPLAQPWMSAGYNATLYRWLPRPIWMKERILPCGVPVYYSRLGNGWIIVLPINPVWAYNSTHNDTYLYCVKEAVELAESLASSKSSSVPSAIIVAAAALAAAAASLAENQRSENRQDSLKDGNGVSASILGIRLSEEEAKAHPLRRRILELLEERGAVHFNELWRLVGGSKATLAWHISLLERLKIVATVRYKKYLIIYKAGPRGIEAMFRSLAERDNQFCRLVGLVEKNVSLEEVSRKMRVSSSGLRAMYPLIREYLGVAKRVCANA